MISHNDFAMSCRPLTWKKSGLVLILTNLSMEDILGQIIDNLLETDKVKKYLYPVLYVIVSFNLIILLLLLFILYFIITNNLAP
jgi:hypothetical protein